MRPSKPVDDPILVVTRKERITTEIAARNPDWRFVLTTAFIGLPVAIAFVYLTLLELRRPQSPHVQHERRPSQAEPSPPVAPPLPSTRPTLPRPSGAPSAAEPNRLPAPPPGDASTPRRKSENQARPSRPPPYAPPSKAPREVATPAQRAPAVTLPPVIVLTSRKKAMGSGRRRKTTAARKKPSPPLAVASARDDDFPRKRRSEPPAQPRPRDRFAERYPRQGLTRTPPLLFAPFDVFWTQPTPDHQPPYGTLWAPDTAREDLTPSDMILHGLNARP